MASEDDADTRLARGREWLKQLGWDEPDTGMRAFISTWWAWYRSKADFYRSCEQVGKTYFKVERISFSPAKMVCEDWASILFNDRTAITLGETDESMQATDDWLHRWVEDVHLFDSAEPVERAFGLGTAAWALELAGINDDGTANPASQVRLQWYDARSIAPLAWDGGKVTACKFAKPVIVDGKSYTQITAHVPEEGGYVIHTAFFKGNGQQVQLDGYTSAVQTGSATPTFALFSPAVDNTDVDYSPLGASVLDRCIGAVELADLAFDNMNKDITLGQKLVMMDEDLLPEDKDGKRHVPRAENQQMFMVTKNDNITQAPFFHEYNPDLRVADNRAAVDTALSLLGKRAGFGPKYYQLDETGGLKTAKEVAADNAELMRNAKKHEQRISDALVTVCTAAVNLARRFTDPTLADVTGLVAVVFGDTIVEDEQSLRESDRADVAAGLLDPVEYMVRWQGYSAEEATAFVNGQEVVEPIEA